MRKIMSQGLYTVMEGMLSCPEFAADVEVCGPPKLDENNILYGHFSDAHGSEDVFTEDSQLTMDGFKDCIAGL